MQGKSILERQWIRVILFCGAWLGIALSFSIQLYFRARVQNLPVTVGEVLATEMVRWALWAVTSPAVVWLARRYPVGSEHRVRSLMIHLSASVLYSLSHVALCAVYHLLVHWPSSPPIDYMAEIFHQVFFIDFHMGVFIYGVILAINHALKYYRRYQEEELTSSRLEAQLAQAQLQALKMQLHPHFLFNTLQAVAALQLKDGKAANQMIARLGDFLRLTLDSSSAQEVSLRQELEFLKCYLEIERIRFQDRLAIHLDIDSQSLSARVPNLILQPLVENAIKHGIAPRAAAGRIEVRSYRQDGMLSIEVYDDGPGLRPGKGGILKMEEGVGIANTRARLLQLYGAAHQLEFTNAPEGGLTVTLQIPFAITDSEYAGNFAGK